MTLYRIKSIKESIKKIFANHLDHVCFCIDTANKSDIGVCDVVVNLRSEGLL